MKGLAESIRTALEAGRPNNVPEHLVTTARDIMVTKLICLRPTQTIREAIDVLLKYRISGAPVLAGEGRLVGMLSAADCMRDLATCQFYGDGDPCSRSVEELMSRQLITIAPETDIYSIADRFLTDSLRRLPVVEDGQLRGQVSRRDVLRAMQQMW